MVLGFILYETADIVFHVGKFTVNGLVGIYNWYYDINHYTPIPGNDRFEELENKIDKLTKQLELTTITKD
jgi:hypothetical protein|uniref:Uncharacterized protein n=1 Tax=viral metagenome TaxID=1070528 RepID=A0A6C0BZ65_9ZZZZ